MWGNCFNIRPFEDLRTGKFMTLSSITHLRPKDLSQDLLVIETECEKVNCLSSGKS